jgi:hypothetical protein
MVQTWLEEEEEEEEDVTNFIKCNTSYLPRLTTAQLKHDSYCEKYLSDLTS